MQRVGDHSQGGVVAKTSVSISVVINLIEFICYIIFFFELYRHKKRHKRLSHTYTPELARRHAEQVGNSKAIGYAISHYFVTISYTISYLIYYNSFH